MREKYKLNDSPTPSDEECDSSDEDEDGFGPKKEKVEEDPVASELVKVQKNIDICFQRQKQWRRRQ